MPKIIISILIAALIVAIKLFNWPVGESYTTLWEVIVCSIFFIVAFVVAMIVLPNFKNED